MKKIKQELEKSINKYVDLFCEKHDLINDGWIGDEVGSNACLSDYIIYFGDIRHDLDNDVPKHLFVEWYDLIFELACKDEPIINYETFLKIN